jgi:ribonuclease P protein component
LSETGRKYSFSRACRLEGPNGYATVLAHKCRVSGRWFQIYAKPNGAEQVRLGVVVSKRIMKKAVARNSFKRMVREVFRNACERWSGIDFVVRPRAPVESAESTAARVELGDLLRLSVGECRSREPATAN